MITINQIGHPKNGRFGNTLFLYCLGKALARKFNTELLVPKTWIGLQIFNIEDKIVDNSEVLPNTKFDEIPEFDNLNLFGYYQYQDAID